jgi:hypothetical protein
VHTDSYGKDYTFGVRPEASRRMYVFAASSEDEENAWVSIIIVSFGRPPYELLSWVVNR